MNFFSIGVFNVDEKMFFDKLVQSNIDTFCDIRQRRAVRGSKYAFVNSKRLQNKLNSLGIKYMYQKDLAPTTEIRSIQKAVDAKRHELKTQRRELGEVFVSEYKNKILENFDFDQLLKSLKLINAKNIVLFCVEEKAKACHRSLVASKISQLYNLNPIPDL